MAEQIDRECLWSEVDDHVFDAECGKVFDYHVPSDKEPPAFCQGCGRAVVIDTLISIEAPSDETINLSDVIDRFRAYYRENPAWGVLHVVLDDGNLDDGFVDGCMDFAIRMKDQEGLELARILRQLTAAQRNQLYELEPQHG